MPRTIKVLAVDDKPANLVALESVLQGQFTVVRATSGPQAIEILKTTQDIDIILMDVQMPILDGFETAAAIKQMDGAQDIPIVFITAVYHEDPWVRKGYEVGAVDYIAKPFDPELLKMKVGVYATLKQRADIVKERELQLRISEELLATSRKLSSTLEKVPLGVVIIDREGGVLQMNDEVFRMFASARAGDAGIDAGTDSWVGTELLVQEQLAELVRAVQRERMAYRELVHIRCLDGSEKAVLCSASPLLQKDRSIRGMVVVIHDMTQSRKIKGDFERHITRLVSESAFLPAAPRA